MSVTSDCLQRMGIFITFNRYDFWRFNARHVDSTLNREKITANPIQPTMLYSRRSATTDAAFQPSEVPVGCR